ncbi:ribosome hibernation-promoting factor, HPF/YfiA family [Xiamenia xianingshaonis]|uniref:Ribosome hibernation promoting factor n=1 Tax=Xiamenia xianingshaonis TaxID=2682776 RepID=A0A9E6SU32_9ACTN|nr:ribosome-associated translation inhibitor RaiA [Xiamenia xianingshaonis]NGM17973.1 ribosome-associated translation inhibitor RaiA [Eggerthellaceae bacterium zg-893]NHM14890.1 ribosome-associated translation inhibitor RaiA [Xiamenia xianingshaonis]NHM16700.1 ribosome-associated translation inhibitor RaiA [Xiamenia xianingshaonis]QTU84053.1 ribosome-associated translation inhibitor RaiA [Xiamenia xianingshaonis]
MSITVTGRRMPVTDALRDYAEEKIGNAMKVMDIDPLVAEVVLYVEKNPANPRPAVCEATLYTKGHIVRVEESEEDMYAAIDVAAAKVVRQLRKYKTKVLDRKQRSEGESIRVIEPTMGNDLDVHSLMDELSGDEIVRVKEIDFKPLTQEEALVQIDLLGHDFFAYTDRDTNLVNVLYRRDDGGYGLLKQKEE